MEWNILDPARVNLVKLLMSLGKIMFFNRVNGKCQIIEPWGQQINMGASKLYDFYN